MHKLIQNIVDQADYFLKHAGEFYPFASVLYAGGEIRPVGIVLDDKRPESQDVLDELIKVLNKGLASGEYAAVAIGLQVLLTKKIGLETEDTPHLAENALEIRVRDSIKKSFRIMALPYIQDAQTNEVVFEEFLRIRQE